MNSTATLKKNPIQALKDSIELSIMNDDIQDNDNDSIAFPIHALPPVMRDMVEEVSRSLAVPIALSAPTALSTLSVALGAGAVIDSGKGRVVHGNTHTVIMAGSGSGKGETHNAMFHPVKEWEKDRLIRFRDEVTPAQLTDLSLLKEKRDSIMKDIRANKGESTSLQRNDLLEIAEKVNQLELQAEDDGSITTENSTSERLIAMVASKDAGAFSVVSSEAKDVLSVIFGRYRQGGETDESVYLKGYSCEGMTMDRRSEGGSVRAPISCLSMALMVQPAVGEKYFSSLETLHSGFFARLLIVDSESRIKLIDPEQEAINENTRSAWGELVTEILDEVRSKAGSERAIISTNISIHRIIADHYNPMIQDVLSGLSVNDSIASRWAENAYKMALLLHIADGGYDSLGQRLSEKTMHNALEIMDWFMVQHRNATSSVEAEARSKREQKLIDLVSVSEGQALTLSILKRNHSFSKEEVERVVRESNGKLVIGMKGKTKPSPFVKLGTAKS